MINDIKTFITNIKTDYNKNNIESFFKFLNSFPLYNILKKNKMFLAGGAITSKLSRMTINDYDLYFTNEKYIKTLFNDINKFNEHVNDINYKYNKKLKTVNLSYKTDNALTYEYGDMILQFIINKNFINEPNKILNNFDFSINQIGYYFYNNNIYYNNITLNDIEERIIHYNINSINPINSIFRIQKYETKLFNISNIEIFKILLSINNCEFKTYSDVITQLKGSSTEYLNDLTKLLNINKTYDFNNLVNDIEINKNKLNVINKLNNKPLL